MKRVFSVVGSLLYILCLSHQIFPMDKLEPELQLLIFAHADNKTSFQSINQDWNRKASIKNNALFTNDFCTILYSKEKGKERLVGILLCAAYNRNYDAVENILKNTGILRRVEDCLPYHFIDKYAGKPYVLDLMGIAFHNKDQKLQTLLQKYKVPGFTPGQTICNPDILIMPCVAGDSETISRLIYFDNRIDSTMIDQCLRLSIDFDRKECLKILLAGALSSHCRIEIGRDLFERACVQHSLSALEELLCVKSFDLNKVNTYVNHDCTSVTQTTFLDVLLDNAKNDRRYDAIVGLFRNYGAMTAAEISSKEEEKKGICIVQ